MPQDNKTEKIIFLLFFLFMLFYYALRMVAISPWYDEVYSYNYFISRGPVYSALHWPLPNNHVFFSVISSLLIPFGNLIALRGISYFSAVGIIILLFIFLKNGNNILAVIVSICFYIIQLLPTTLSVQGRGYCLATFFLVLALLSGKKIFFDDKVKVDKKWYILWFVSLWLGLYTLVSSVYYVVAICVSFGIYALIRKKYRELIKLIIASVYSAFATLLCYGILWASIGSHDIFMHEHYSDTHISIVLSMPAECLKRGFNLMRNNPYMGGVDRSLFIQDFRYFFRQLFGEFFPVTGIYANLAFFAIITIFVMVILILYIFRVKKGNEIPHMWYLFYGLLASVSIIVVFVVLLIQSAYPYARNLSFLGIFFAMVIYVPVNKLFLVIKNKKIQILLTLGIIAITIFMILGSGMMKEYSALDHNATELISKIEFENGSTYMVSDEYSLMQMEYIVIHGRKTELIISDNPDEVDYVIVLKGENSGAWPYIHNGDEIARAISEKSLISENDYYEIWK